VSYAIDWSDDARRAFDALDIEVQEAVLDELDRLAGAATRLPNRPLTLLISHDVRTETTTDFHYIFMDVEYDPPNQMMAIVRLASYSRTK